MITTKCRTLGKVRTSGVERGTLSAFEDFLCALVKVLIMMIMMNVQKRKMLVRTQQIA